MIYVSVALGFLNFLLILYLIRMRSRHYILAQRIDEMAIRWNLTLDDHKKIMDHRHRKIIKRLKKSKYDCRH